MCIKALYINGYRSIQELSIELKQVNVFTGANGSGKSNLYKAIYLLFQAAKGEFAKTMALEGGIPSVIWAGEKEMSNRYSKNMRLKLGFETDTFGYELCCGVPIAVPYSMFNLDPEVKEEYVWFGGKRRISNIYLERFSNSAFIYNKQHAKITYPFNLSSSESILSQLKDPQLYPELFTLYSTIKEWRFYHYFNTDINSPIRSPQLSVRTPVLSDDGYDLAAALRTIIEIGD
jgi:predicted ATPase